MDFTSGVGHPRLDLVRLLVMDGNVQYAGHRYCITVPSGQHQTCREGVKILGRPYTIEL